MLYLSFYSSSLRITIRAWKSTDVHRRYGTDIQLDMQRTLILYPQNTGRNSFT